MQNIVNSKGQIEIPPEILEQLEIKDGDFFQVDIEPLTRHIILTRVSGEKAQNLRGKYKGKGLMKSLMTEKKREKNR